MFNFFFKMLLYSFHYCWSITIYLFANFQHQSLYFHVIRWKSVSILSNISDRQDRNSMKRSAIILWYTSLSDWITVSIYLHPCQIPNSNILEGFDRFGITYKNQSNWSRRFKLMSFKVLSFLSLSVFIAEFS